MLRIYVKVTLFVCFVMMLITSCAHPGPKMTACLINAEANGLDCYNELTGKSSFVPLAQADKYVAMPPADAQTLLQYCASK